MGIPVNWIGMEATLSCAYYVYGNNRNSVRISTTKAV